MQLKKIVLCGFKSFADHTEFTFDRGVTVIVGPNGCGKSNVVDAVKWVLGEQSAKSLRGGQMLDVIFNGSNSRKSMGMAEVTLVFSNTRHLLNTDLDEVAVTRKLYRSGESEYLLNNSPCRLRDIREMFMDTGIGADAYSIIEQGKVEVLLQSSKQDRRAIFEEAAGISKYKARKKEAIRKLERTDQNLLRLMDLIEELEKRLRSIKYQAGKARNYQSYTERLKELRLNQFLSEFHQLQNDADQIQQQIEENQEQILTISSELQRAQNRLSLLDSEIDSADTQIREHENILLQCTSQISNQEDRIDMGRKRCDELEQIVQRSRQQMQSLRQRIQILHQQSEQDQADMEAAQRQLQNQQQELEQVQQARQQQALELNEYRAQLDDEKSGLIDIVRRTAQLHNEINSLDHQKNTLTGQKNRLHDRSSQIGQQIEQLIVEHVQYEDKQQKIQSLLAQSQEQLESKRQQLAQVSQQRLACTEQLASAKEKRSGMMSRKQVLADLEAKYEGVDQGVRHILQSKKQAGDNFYYIRGMVAELIHADVQYAGLVEAALADRAQNLVASSSQSILEDDSSLKQLKGRIQVICLNQLPPYSNGYDFSVHPEVKAHLIDLVRYAPENESLAWHLLGKTILVDSLDSALRLAQTAPPGYRWVTPNGEVLEADGTLHVGPRQTAHGLISRKSELHQIAQDLEQVEESIRQLQNQSEQFNNQAQHLEKNLQELRTVIYENNTEQIETRSRLEQLDQNLNRLKQEQPLISSEIASLEHQIDQSVKQQIESRQDLENLQSVNQQRQQHIDELEERIRQLSEQDRQMQDQITDRKVELSQTRQKQLALQEKIHSVHTQIHQAQHNIKTMQHEMESSQQNMMTAQQSILKAEMAISELFQTRQISQEKTRSLRGQKDGLLEEKLQWNEQARLFHNTREELQQKLHECQMHQNENQLRRENIMQRAQEELNLDIARSLQDYTVQQMDWDAVAQEVADLKQKIERLGNVNLDAITEQEELEQRSGSLTQQAADLQESKRQLEQLIQKINQQSEELFRSNFEAIRQHFSELFRKLFGGGRADIILEEPENILECGIEIIARPPGKQPQSISLLSGGEKTMTAVALLLAIFKSKPSPFCLMDEVDAALDEANNERFNLVVQEFLKDSQFVIITHSRRTMTIGDVLYGVTMQEQGVSKKVAVKFNASEEEGTDTAVA